MKCPQAKMESVNGTARAFSVRSACLSWRSPAPSTGIARKRRNRREDRVVVDVPQRRSASRSRPSRTCRSISPASAPCRPISPSTSAPRSTANCRRCSSQKASASKRATCWPRLIRASTRLRSTRPRPSAPRTPPRSLPPRRTSREPRRWRSRASIPSRTSTSSRPRSTRSRPPSSPTRP